MNDPEREQELWQRVAAAGQPDEKKRRGMAAALPHCDRLLSGHSLAALHDVAEAIGADT